MKAQARRGARRHALVHGVRETQSTVDEDEQRRRPGEAGRAEERLELVGVPLLEAQLDELERREARRLLRAIAFLAEVRLGGVTTAWPGDGIRLGVWRRGEKEAAHRSSVVNCTSRLFDLAMAWMTLTASSSRPVAMRYLGDSCIGSTKKRIAHRKSMSAPRVYIEYRQPELFSRVHW